MELKTFNIKNRPQNFEYPKTYLKTLNIQKRTSKLKYLKTDLKTMHISANSSVQYFKLTGVSYEIYIFNKRLTENQNSWFNGIFEVNFW